MKVFKIIEVLLLEGYADTLTGKQIILLQNRDAISKDLRLSSMPTNLGKVLDHLLILAENAEEAHTSVVQILEPYFNGILFGIPKEVIGYRLSNIQLDNNVIDCTQWRGTCQTYKLVDGASQEVILC